MWPGSVRMPDQRPSHTRQGVKLGARSAALLVIGAAIAAYLPALANGFVWDDPLILDYQLPAFRTLGDVFFPPRNLPHAGSFYYRPLVFLSYLFDRWLGGGSAVAFHATPILLHALASGLLLVLLWQLLGRREWLAPTLAALLFAVHPVHVEVVAWLAGRADSLATVGVLVALLAWGRWLEGGPWGWLVGGGLALCLGLLAKESAASGAILGAALPWVWPARKPRGGAAIGLLWATIGAAMFAYFLLRDFALSVTPGVALGAAPSLHASRLFGALGFYVGGLLWPTRPGAVLTAAPIAWSSIGLGLGGAALAALAFGVALYNRDPLPAWALAWIGVGLLPALLLVVRFISETPVAERYLYLPSAGAALLIAWGFAALPQRARGAATIVAAGALVAMAAVTARRATLWHDEIRFWSNAIALAPDEGPAHLKLAAALIERGDHAAAETTYRRGLHARLTAEQRSVAQVNLAHLVLEHGDAAEAESLARAAMATSRPDLVANSALVLGHAALARSDQASARKWFDYAVHVAPGSPSAAEARQALAALQRP